MMGLMQDLLVLDPLIKQLCAEILVDAINLVVVVSELLPLLLAHKHRRTSPGTPHGGVFHS